MHSVTTRKAPLAALLVLAARLSIFAAGKRASDPAYHQASIDALAEKQETVLELTAAATAASAAITLLPGDTATPIAEKLADLSGYFLIVLCAIFLEKYLLTITSYVSFTVLPPAARAPPRADHPCADPRRDQPQGPELLMGRAPASGRQRQRGPSRPRRTFHRFVLAVRAR